MWGLESLVPIVLLAQKTREVVEKSPDSFIKSISLPFCHRVCYYLYWSYSSKLVLVEGCTNCICAVAAVVTKLFTFANRLSHVWRKTSDKFGNKNAAIGNGPPTESVGIGIGTETVLDMFDKYSWLFLGNSSWTNLTVAFLHLSWQSWRMIGTISTGPDCFGFWTPHLLCTNN